MELARPARPEDLAAVADLLARAADVVAEHRGGPELLAERGLAHPVDAAALLTRLAGVGSRDGVVLVGTWDEVVVATAIVVPVAWPTIGERVAEICALWVDPDARALGVGEALLEAAQSWAAERGCAGLQSEALPGDRETKNAFERFGMVTRRLVVFRRLAPPGGQVNREREVAS